MLMDVGGGRLPNPSPNLSVTSSAFHASCLRCPAGGSGAASAGTAYGVGGLGNKGCQCGNQLADIFHIASLGLLRPAPSCTYQGRGRLSHRWCPDVGGFPQRLGFYCHKTEKEEGDPETPPR